jgi:hypothetical protein
MTDTAGSGAVADTGQPGERGRYALFSTDAGPVIARATGLCDRCLECGCGTQQEPIDLTPPGVMRFIRDHDITLPGPRELLRMMAGRNGG